MDQEKLFKYKDIKYKQKPLKRNKKIFVILENIQYATNVASILRTLDVCNVRRVYLTGTTHTPPFGSDLRKISRSAEKSLEWVYYENSIKAIANARSEGYKIIAVELTANATSVYDFADSIKSNDEENLCIVFGNENYGINKKTLEHCNMNIFVPIFTRNSTLSLPVKVGIVLYLV